MPRECSVCSRRHRPERGCPLPPIWRWLMVIGFAIIVFFLVVSPFLPVDETDPVKWPEPGPTRSGVASTRPASPTVVTPRPWTPPPVKTVKPVTPRPGK